MAEFYTILAEKIIKIPEFLWYLAEKLTNSRILHDFARKMSDFYIIIVRKNFPELLGGRAPLPPVSYAYVNR